MALKNLLVAYNGSDSSKAALKVAIQMHHKYGAHVTGLLAHTSSKERLSHQTWVPDNLRQTLDKLEAERHADIEDAFQTTVKIEIPQDMWHWIARSGRSDATVAEYARMYDLVVVGRHDAVSDNREFELHPDRIALKSGRPVLVVPPDWSRDSIHEHAILAWDGHRAATRALSDAMQILETKQLVTVLVVDDGRSSKALPGIDVITALARHNVPTESVQVKSRGRSVGETILTVCQERDAGLLVMGAYEQSLFMEEFFGGTTRHIVENASLPILISH